MSTIRGIPQTFTGFPVDFNINNDLPVEIISLSLSGVGTLTKNGQATWTFACARTTFLLDACSVVPGFDVSGKNQVDMYEVWQFSGTPSILAGESFHLNAALSGPGAGDASGTVDWTIDVVTAEPAGVPEPASLLLMGSGLVAISCMRRKKKDLS